MLFHLIIVQAACAQKSESKKTEMNQIENSMTQQLNNPNEKTDTATFGLGCFWCSETIFLQIDGVQSVTSGYSGGEKPDPSYNEVCSGSTGHAEVVQIIYDPSKTSFDDLLKAFWMAHDPTTLNRQGADVGTQYRSVIFYHNEYQKTIAEHYKQLLNKNEEFQSPVVTEISVFTVFYKAENYHQDYFNKNISAPYCQMVISPKLEKFKKTFEGKLKK